MPDGKSSINWHYAKETTIHGLHTSPFMAEAEADLMERFSDEEVVRRPPPPTTFFFSRVLHHVYTIFIDAILP